MSMRYINLILPYTLLLCACSSAPKQDPVTTAKTDTAEAATPSPAEKDIRVYAQALSKLNAGQFDQAETILVEITAKHPELAGPWTNLGLVYINKNQLDKASDALNQAITKNPDLAQAYNLLGYIETKHGNIPKAKQLYEKALAKKNDYALAHYNLALLYDVYLRDIPKAIEHYQRYLELIKVEDKPTADWVNELMHMLKKS
ncbi:MAG: tetratricopeptide repeat protein [Gammaproteobacteria bacterium]|nr:tetratricopeptide repeat protein [Gammaproteobacteria bacterium]